MSYADPAKRREARLRCDRKRNGSKPWRPGGPGRPPKGAVGPQEWKRKGLCVKCGGKPKADRLRCEPCLKKQRDWDKAYRDGLKGGSTVEPQCNVAGKLRADHVFDEDGLCDCGARKMEFAPRTSPVEGPSPQRLRTGLDDGPLLPRARPGKGAAHRPSPAQRAAFAGARSFAEPRAAPKVAPKPPEKVEKVEKVEKRIGGTGFGAIIDDLEQKRAAIDAVIAGIRSVEEWWPK